MRKKVLHLFGVFALLFSVLFPSISSVADAATDSGFMRKAHLTTTSGYGTPTPGFDRGNGILPHFTVDDNIGKAYCYNWDLDAPDKPGQEFNQYQFWNGMGYAEGPDKASQVAAAMMQGYHLNQDTGQWEVGESFKALAQQGYQEVLNSFPYPSDVSPSYSLADYEQDVTQAVIWKLDGSPSTEGYNEALLDTAFGAALYDYARNHPLDQATAEATNVVVKSNGNVVNDSNPLVIDSTTLQSPTFTVEGYNGAISIGSLNGNIQVIDAQTGKAVDRIMPGQTYYLKASAAGENSKLDLGYQKVSDSHYFSVEDLNTGANANNPYQNLVNLATQTSNLPVKYVFEGKESSSTSSDTTNSESTTSSVDTASSTTSTDSGSTSSDVISTESTTSSVDTASSTTGSETSSTSSDATNSESTSSVDTASGTTGSETSSTSSDATNSESTTSEDTASSTTDSESSDVTNSESTTSSNEKHEVVISKQGNNNTNDKSNGSNGESGVNGTNGANGSNGEAGANGTNGANGSNGESGSNGSGITKYLGSLPQTGNKKSVVLTVIGLVLVIAVVVIIVVKRKSKK